MREVVNLLRRRGSDDDRFEAKASAGGLPKSVWASVSAFANCDGGYLLLGLDEEEGFQPTRGFDPDKVINQFREGMSEAPEGSPKVQPVPDYELSQHEIDGAQIVLVKIEPLKREDRRRHPPCFVTSRGVNQGSYKRIGDGDVRLTPYEIYLLDRSSHLEDKTDRESVENMGLEDLDRSLINGLIRRVIDLGSRTLAGIEPSNVHAAMRRLDVIDDQGRLTIAGLLTLAYFPQQEFPSLVIDVTVHPGVEKSQRRGVRFLDRRVCDGPIPLAIEDAVSTVLRNLKTRRVVTGVGGEDVPEIPEDVLREAIVNAVMHRDYSLYVRGQQVAVDVFPDRVEITSPGGFWGDRSQHNIYDGKSQARNPALARLLRLVPGADEKRSVAEGQGSGIPLMVSAMREYGLPAPDYRSSTIDHVVVKLQRFGLLDPEIDQWLAALPDANHLSRDERLAMAIAATERTIDVAELRARLGLDSDECRTVLASLLEKGLLEGSGDGPYVVARVRPDITFSPLELNILALLSRDEPLSVAELAVRSGRSVHSVRRVLRSLGDQNVIDGTAPPQSRYRKYVLTEPGERLIKGRKIV